MAEAKQVKACLKLDEYENYRGQPPIYTVDVRAMLGDPARFVAQKKAKTWLVAYLITSPIRPEAKHYFGVGKEFELAYIRAKCRAFLNNKRWDIPRGAF